MNNTELCRVNLYKRLGINTTKKRDTTVMMAEIKLMQSKLDEITKLAKDRLFMGGLRYGSDWTNEALMDYMQKKFDLYQETGNLEFLVDLINLSVIESALKTNPKAHFKANDRK